MYFITIVNINFDLKKNDRGMQMFYQISSGMNINLMLIWKVKSSNEFVTVLVTRSPVAFENSSFVLPLWYIYEIFRNEKQ